MLTLPVFYHPSTIAWVDDDQLFLNTVSQIFPSDHLIQSCTNPKDCLKFFKNYVPPLTKIPLLRAFVDHEYHDTANHSLVNFNVPALQQLHDYSERIKEVSIIIVDYQMPEMNGIALCEKLHELPIKKILLTGEADHRDALAAFNNNTIDRFIRKDSPSLVADIQTYVTTLTQQYFRERTRPLLSHLEADNQLPLSDPIFVDFFQHWCNAHHIKEYFLIDKNGSFLVINQKNQRFYFILHTKRTLNAFIKLHDDIVDAKTYITAINQHEKIPFFGIGKEGWQFDLSHWPQYFHSPKILDGREKYYWAICDETKLTGIAAC